MPAQLSSVTSLCTRLNSYRDCVDVHHSGDVHGEELRVWSGILSPPRPSQRRQRAAAGRQLVGQLRRLRGVRAPLPPHPSRHVPFLVPAQRRHGRDTRSAAAAAAGWWWRGASRTETTVPSQLCPRSQTGSSGGGGVRTAASPLQNRRHSIITIAPTRA